MLDRVLALLRPPGRLQLRCVALGNVLRAFRKRQRRPTITVEQNVKRRIVIFLASGTQQHANGILDATVHLATKTGFTSDHIYRSISSFPLRRTTPVTVRHSTKAVTDAAREVG
jgi:hypothetical protein